MKVINQSNNSEVAHVESKMTEINEVTPVMPDSLRNTPKNAIDLAAALKSGAVAGAGAIASVTSNLEPCGEYCKWLSAES